MTSATSASVTAAYTALVGRWDTSGAAWNRPVAVRLVALAQLTPGMAVQDIGCGAGAATAEPVTTCYASPQQWWESSWTQGPALAWQHIPPSRRGAARDEAFKILTQMRGPDGTLARARTTCYTTATAVPPADLDTERVGTTR
jgi:hypothetical protein